MHKLTSFESAAVAIATRAAELVLRIYEKGAPKVEQKPAAQGPLTEADIAANELICEHLAKLTPGLVILSEESAHTGVKASTFWAIDPLDGTKEFLNRNGEFTVNIALIENGLPTFGVVIAPVGGETWLGVGRNCSVSKKTKPLALKRQGNRQPWQPIASAASTLPAGGLRVVASRSHPSAALDRWLGSLRKPLTLIEKGSSIKLCLVAEGAAHLYPRLAPTSIWDTAAGHALALASGASVLALNEDGAVTGELFYSDATEVVNPFFLVACPAFLRLKNLTY